MRLPSLLNYQSAVANPPIAFRHVDLLRTGEPVRNAQGMPSVASGGFAATFAIDSASNQRFAVRCFHKQGHDERRLRERYEHIYQFVVGHPNLTFLIDAVYQPDGIMVNGTGFPTVRMRWSTGEMLGVWVEDWIEGDQDPVAIETVRVAIADAVVALRAAGAAHGDLQHGNILVGRDRSITLIDYDGMFVDTFAGTGLPAIEQGHRNYQHPGRGGRFDSGIDTFAAAVIDVSLRALRHQPSLWDDFGGTGENLIFTARDFVDPENSPLFAALACISGVADAAAALKRACRTDYDYVETVLAGTGAGAPAAGGFELTLGQFVAGSERDELLNRAGETITVYGKIQFGIVNKGFQGRDVALINLGDYRRGDFTIVAHDSVARQLFDKYGSHSTHGKRLLPKLKDWQIAITGTVVTYVNKGVHVPQIELVRVGLLRNLTDQQIAALKSPPPAVAPAPPRPTRAPKSAGAPPIPSSTRAAAVVPPTDRSAAQARRQAELSRLYESPAMRVRPPAAPVRTSSPSPAPPSTPTPDTAPQQPRTSRSARPAPTNSAVRSAPPNQAARPSPADPAARPAPPNPATRPTSPSPAARLVPGTPAAHPSQAIPAARSTPATTAESWWAPHRPPSSHRQAAPPPPPRPPQPPPPVTWHPPVNHPGHQRSSVRWDWMVFGLAILGLLTLMILVV
ncbi:hypothetical protein ACFWF3_23390 [Nocardia sp. NPDC060220]|uniref:hypothetical protein n=1 Tax=Nocardia sp. NPDC060220 TaxID=3347076 RepID=UPI00364F49D0